MSGARRATRRAEWSQHALRRGALAASLVDAAGIGPTDLVVEIGAGAGTLTEPLRRRARRVIAVELDPRLVHELEMRFAGTNVEVVAADFLRYRMPSEPVRVVGNIPYARTAEIVRRVLGHASVVDAHLVMQREAAGRFAGAPFGDESLASLTLKPWWHAEVVRQLRPVDFDPPPRVDSAVLWLARRSPSLLSPGERARFEAFLGQAFGRHRTMREALMALFTREQARRLTTSLRIEGSGPPSSVRFEEWLALYRFWRLAR